MLVTALGVAVAAAQTSSQASVPERRQLQTTILQILINDPELGQYPLAASVSPDRVVTLNGVVPNKADRDVAVKLIKSIPGVSGVDNEISVNASVTPLTAAPAANPSSPASPAVTPDAAPTSQDVQAAVANALASDPDLHAVQATADAESVTLTGPVATKADRKRAQEIAARVAPHRRIVNQIQVRHQP